MPRLFRPCRIPTLIASAVLLAGACDSPPGNGSAGSKAVETIDDVIAWDGELVLEDAEGVVSAQPVVSPDPLGGFIVADRQENQVRTYGPGGSLKAYFGRPGEGPREFVDLEDATRDQEGRIVALTSANRISTWSATGDSLIAVRHAPPRASSIAAGAGGHVIVAVNPVADEDFEATVVTILDPVGSGTSGAFLKPYLTEENAAAFTTVRGPAIEGLGVEKVVSIPVSDTIWVIDTRAAAATRKVAIPSRLLAGNVEPVDPRRDRAGFFEWINESWYAGPAFPLSAGGWLVSLWRRQGEETVWGLTRVHEDGSLAWEIEGTPRLMTVDADDRLIFDDPASLFPNHLLVGRVKR